VRGLAEGLQKVMFRALFSSAHEVIAIVKAGSQQRVTHLADVGMLVVVVVLPRLDATILLPGY
jgi:hypothetical protein